MSAFSLSPASAAAFRTAGRAPLGIRSHAFLVMTVAPTSGAHRRSSMCGASPNHCDDRARSGVVSKALMSPVCNPVRISVDGRGTGWNPAVFQRSTASLSPAQTNSFIFLTSSGVPNGSLAKNITQPASPQFSTTKSFSRSLFSSAGRRRSRT